MRSQEETARVAYAAAHMRLVGEIEWLRDGLSAHVEVTHNPAASWAQVGQIAYAAEEVGGLAGFLLGQWTSSRRY